LIHLAQCSEGSIFIKTARLGWWRFPWYFLFGVSLYLFVVVVVGGGGSDCCSLHSAPLCQQSLMVCCVRCFFVSLLLLTLGFTATGGSDSLDG
jgi:hypothetical protein